MSVLKADLVLPKISMVIPTFTLTKELERLAVWCAASYRDQVDELIITEDGGMYSPQLMGLADIYIYNKDNGGFSKNVNSGWKHARGEYVMIVNSDTHLESGNLGNLCLEGRVTSPETINQLSEGLTGNFWCAPAEVTRKYGYLLEDLHTYCSDADYGHRTKEIFVHVPSVRIYHHMAKTTDQAGIGEAQLEADREVYGKLIEEGKASYAK